MRRVPVPPGALLFDLDGTLADTAPEFERIVNAMRTARGQAPVTDRFRTAVSGGARSMLLETFGHELPAARFDALIAEFLERYRADLGSHTRLFPGMHALLKQCASAGIPWGVVTNKPERFSIPLLETLGIADACACCICPEQVTVRKPDPEGLHLACRQLKCRPEDSVYVGDHVRDIEAGRNAGLFTIAVRYGYIPHGERVEDWHADRAVDTASDIGRLIFPPETTHV